MKPELNHNATGVKRPFKLEEIWRIRTRIEIQNNLMQLALLNLAIDSKLRSCDLLSLKVRDVATHNWSVINDKDQPAALIANCMRNVVEYFFNFVQKSDLSNVMQKQELQDVKYQAFIRYINRESHSLGQNIIDFKEFDYGAFREGLRLLFEITGYPEHYQKMSQI